MGAHQPWDRGEKIKNNPFRSDVLPGQSASGPPLKEIDVPPFFGGGSL